MAPGAGGGKSKFAKACVDAAEDLKNTEGTTPPNTDQRSHDKDQSSTRRAGAPKRKPMKSAMKGPMKSTPAKSAKDRKKPGHVRKGKMSKTPGDLKKTKGRTAMKKAADRKGQSSDRKGHTAKSASIHDDPSGSTSATAVEHPGEWVQGVPPISNSIRWV